MTTKSGQRISISAPILEFSEDEFDDSVAEQRRLSKKLEAQKLRDLQARENDRKTSAARKIWRIYRIWKVKNEKEFRIVQGKLLSGMIPSELNYENLEIQKSNQEAREIRRLRKSEFDERFKKAVEDENARIVKLKTPYIMEDISDHIRSWFQKFHNGVGELDRYPEEFETGTILVIRGETKTVKEYREWLEWKKKEAEKTKEVKLKEKEETKKLKAEAIDERKKSKAQARKKLREKKELDKLLGPEWDFTEKKFRTKNVCKLLLKFLKLFSSYKTVQ